MFSFRIIYIVFFNIYLVNNTLAVSLLQEFKRSFMMAKVRDLRNFVNSSKKNNNKLKSG